MTNASRRLGTDRLAPTKGSIACLAQRFLQLILIAALIVSLFIIRTSPTMAQSHGGFDSWLIEQVDIALPVGANKEDRRSLQSPSLVVDANQQPHIIYNEDFKDGSPSQLIYATRSASVWVTRTTGLNGNANPALALTTQGQLRTSFLDFSMFDNMVLYGQSTDGVSWTSQPVTLGFNSSQSSSDLVLDSHDQAVIAFGSKESTVNPIYRMSLATQLSSTWAIQPIADGNGIKPVVAVDALSQTHVSYLHVLNLTRSVVSYAIFANGTWITETIGDIDVTTDLVPSRIAVDAGNTPHIAYTNRTRNELVYASRTNGVWTRQVITGNVDALDLVLDSAGLPHIAYIEPTVPHRLVYATQTAPNGNWISSTVNTNSKDDPLPPISIALGPTGLPYIAYIDFTTGDLHLARIGQALYVPVVLH